MMQSHANFSRRFLQNRSGLTLIEMVVAVSLLVVVILGVGLIFQHASAAVGTSEKTMEMLSNVRSIQAQIERDIAGIDKNCFLVIRSANGNFTDSSGNTDSTSNPIHRCDLISFISYGSFPHRTGNRGSAYFTDNNTVVPSAFITWGQLALAKNGGSNTSPTNATTYLDGTNQSYHIPLNQVPTGVITSNSGYNEGGMALGRNAMLLAPKNVSTINDSPAGLIMASFQNNGSRSAVDWNNTETDIIAVTGETYADITQSRVDLAATTPSQIMSDILQAVGPIRSATNARYEADHFCYRHSSVISAFDGLQSTTPPNYVNGYFRMHPIALQGVSSFAIEWTDGLSTYVAGNIDPVTGQSIPSFEADGVTPDPRIGTTMWFGPGNTKGNSSGVDPTGNGSLNGANTSDTYCAVFSYDTKDSKGVSLWPVALRFRYHVADSTGRLVGGRDFTQIVKLPS